MDTRGRSLSLEFGNPCHAVQLRITPQLKDALLNANLAGESIQMRLDEGTGVIVVGGQEISFKANEETTPVDLLRIPQSSDGSPAEEVAQIRQKLHIQRQLDDEERRRARERSLIAERQQKERKLMRLNTLPQPAKGPRKVKRPSGQPAVHTVAPQRMPTQPASAVAPRVPSTLYQRPATPPVSRGPTPPPPSAVVQRAETPPLGALAAKPPKNKSRKLLSRLAKPGGSTPGRPNVHRPAQARAKEPPPAAAIEGAKQSVPLCLLGLLSERDFRRPTQVEQALAEVAARVPAFKPPTGQALTEQIKRVAQYKSPGIYVVLPQYEGQARELKLKAATAAAVSTQLASKGNTPDLEAPSRGSSPETAPSPSHQQQPQPQPQQKQDKKLKMQQQSQQVNGKKGVGTGQQRTPEPQRRPSPHPRAGADRALPQSTPEPMLQLVEDDLGAPPKPKPTPAAKQPARSPASKAKVLSPAGASLQQQQQQLWQANGAGQKGLQSKPWPAKRVADVLQLRSAAVAGGSPEGAPSKQQKRKSPGGTPGPKRPPAAQPSIAAPVKAAKRPRTILEESDEDSGDDWVPNGRRRGSSEEGGFGSGGPGSGRAPAGGSNSTSSLPRSSPSSDEPLNLPPAKRQHSEHSPPVIRDMPRAPSALASSNYADDSWFAAYESRQPTRYAPVADARSYSDYCTQYSAKYQVYHKLHQEMSSVTRYVKALKEGAQSAASEAERQEYGAQAERLYSRTETLMQRWASAFKVLHAELEDLFKKLNEYREAALRGDVRAVASMPVGQALAV